MPKPIKKWLPKTGVGLSTHLEEDGLVVLNEQQEQIHQFNGTALTVFEACNGSRTTEDIAALICDRFEVDSEQAMRDVLSFLEELRSKGLVI